MTEPAPRRKPRVFSTDDPALVVPAPEAASGPEQEYETPADSPLAGTRPSAVDFKRSFRWGALFVSAMASLTLLAASIAFTSFIFQALARQDWIGWTATALAGLAVLSAIVLVLRELIGLFRLARLDRLRKGIASTIVKPDVATERQQVTQLKALLSNHPDLRWGLARLADHERDVRDPGQLLRLAERELIVPLDRQARGLILKSAKRVSMVTALSPFVWVAMIFVLVENLKVLRGLATLYGGRPGFAGSLRLARLVTTHIIATGGLALTDDLLGQFLGQDLLRRLSRRLGEGAFNGALTARIGTAAIEVIRPLPYLEADPVRARDILPELFKSWKKQATGSNKA